MRPVVVVLAVVLAAPSQALLPTVPGVPGEPFLTLEHVNINMAQTSAAIEFWCAGLGFVEDPRAAASLKRTMDAGGGSRGLAWVNVGLQQLHLPVEDPPQTLRGHLEVAYSATGLDEVARRLRSLGIPFERSTSGEVTTQDQQGNKVVCRLWPDDLTATWFGPASAIPPSPTVALPSVGDALSLGLGLQAVHLRVPRGAAQPVCSFYRRFFHPSDATVVEDDHGTLKCVVPMGFHQSLVFAEVDGDEVGAYDGHHVAVYVNNFEEIYYRLKASELIYNNPRFPQFTYPTLEAALEHNEFRFTTFVDVDQPDSPAVYELEHEVRSVRHPGFCCKSWVPETADSSEL